MKNMIVKWFLGGIFRDIAEGKKGESAKKAYWWLAGRKRTWSALAGLAFAGFAAWKPALAIEWAPTVVVVLGFMVTVGIMDKDWKESVPPVEWAKTFQALLSLGPAISALFALVIGALGNVPGCDSCADIVPQLQVFAGGVAAVTAWLAARFAVPPAFPQRRAEDLK